MTMNLYDEINSEPNFWLSCMLIKPEGMYGQVRGEREALYLSESGKSCSMEILETLAKYNAEGRPIWKPMHMQMIFEQTGDARPCSDEFHRDDYGKIDKIAA